MKFKKAEIKSHINELDRVNPCDLGVYRKINIKAHHCFLIGESVKALEKILEKAPVLEGECLKIISYSGGYASIAFIKHIAEQEVIKELFASTLRVGKKQLYILDELYEQGKLEKADFVIGGIMKNDDGKKYDYYKDFVQVCKKNKWNFTVINNHSKIILMRTNENYYALETSSNLNENPKIEQFSFQNDKDLYDFYKSFFDKIKEVAQGEC